MFLFNFGWCAIIIISKNIATHTTMRMHTDMLKVAAMHSYLRTMHGTYWNVRRLKVSTK